MVPGLVQKVTRAGSIQDWRCMPGFVVKQGVKGNDSAGERIGEGIKYRALAAEVERHE